VAQFLESIQYIGQITRYMVQGVGITLGLYAITIVFSIPLGILGALGKVSNHKYLSRFLGFYTWVFRGTPLMLQLFFIYFGLPNIPYIGLRLDQFQASVITFILNYAAYFIEIFRGGILSIDKGQYEAAKALGLSYYLTMWKIILPQTIRNVLPAISNEAITLVKDTALVSAIGLGDLLRNGKEIALRDFSVFPFVVAAVFYLFFSSIVVTVFRNLEKKYSFE